MRQILVTLVAGIGMMYLTPSAFAKGSERPKEAHAESCLAKGSSPAKFNLEDSGMDIDMKMVEGIYGPEIQIGDVRIFPDPTAGKGQGNDSGTRWCIIDPTKNKENKQKADYANCYSLGVPSDPNAKPLEVSAQGTNGKSLSFKIKPTDDYDYKGMKSTRLSISPSSFSSDRKNTLIVRGVANSSNGRVTSDMRIESQNLTGQHAGKTNGVIESQMEGTIAKGEGSDTNQSKKMASCSSTMEGRGQNNTSAHQVASDVNPLMGSHYKMRGSEVYTTDGYGTSTDKDSSGLASMSDRKGRSSSGLN